MNDSSIYKVYIYIYEILYIFSYLKCLKQHKIVLEYLFDNASPIVEGHLTSAEESFCCVLSMCFEPALTSARS